MEAKCSMLQNLALNLRKDSLSSTSNNKDPANSVQAELKEEDTVLRLKEPMDIEQQQRLVHLVVTWLFNKETKANQGSKFKILSYLFNYSRFYHLKF